MPSRFGALSVAAIRTFADGATARAVSGYGAWPRRRVRPHREMTMSINLLSPRHPVWGMAFRPFYLLAALYGALSVLLWGFGYAGTAALPSFYWHAHEMLWGYAGAVVVGFLLTAVATWTGQPRLHGRPLMLLAALWLLARIGAFSTALAWPGAVAGVAFYWLAALYMGQSVWRSRNRRNYPAVVALWLFGAVLAGFHGQLAAGRTDSVQYGLLAALAVVAGFIGLVGMRVVPFFTAKRLGHETVATHPLLMQAALFAPLLMAALYVFQAALPVAAALALLVGLGQVWQTVRWWQSGVAREPMLWVLFAGFALTGTGLAVMGAAHWQPQWLSLGVHLVAVGGIGVMTIGMMVRTALGHTGRPLYPAPRLMTAAFGLMLAATAFRALAAWMLYLHPTAYQHSLRLSAVLFAAALLLYVWRYRPWLLAARADGKPG